MWLKLLVAVLILVTTSAEADPRWGGGGHGGPHFGNWGHYGGHYEGPYWGNPLGSVLGGIVGGYLWRQFNPPEEAPELVPGTPAWFNFCANKYRSFDPETGTYLGYDGVRHRC